jgi:hypothetical protein
MTDETPVHMMSPEQAGARLDEMKLSYEASQIPADAAPPPPGVSATTPGQAAARLAQLKADPQWRTRVLTGSGREAREFSELTALAAQGDMTDHSSEIEFVDAVSNPSALRKSHYDGMLDAMRENNNLPAATEEFIRAVDRHMATGNYENDLMPTEGDGLVFKEAKERWLRDPGVRARILAGDFATVKQFNGMVRVIALATQDGQPATDEAVKILTKLGLR